LKTCCILGALPMIWFYRDDLKKVTRDEAWAGVQVGLLMFGGYAFQTAGIARTTPSKAAFITGLSVVLVPVFLAAFWRKKIGAWAWAGAAASFIGLYLLTVPATGLAELNRGDVLVMVCAVLYALQIIFIAGYTGKYSLGALSCLQVILAGVLSTIAVPILNITGWEHFFVRFTFQMGFGVIVSEFTLHHLPDFWKAVALARIFAALKPGANFYLRDIVFVSMPDGVERDVEQWADFSIKNHDFERESVVTHMRDEYSTFGWVIERMLTDVGFTLESVDYHAPLHGTYLLRKPKPGHQQS
jgi:hypothetical protein